MLSVSSNLGDHMFQRRQIGERVNQLGGSYRNGKPLSSELRQKVIKMSMSGIRPCEISRRLKVTHGCISKLLSKFYKTGSLNPGHGTAGRPRVITPRIEQHIERFRKEQPGIFSWEIRERLLREGVCDQSNLPSLSSISRLVKNKIKQKAESSASGSKCSLSFSISNILSNDFRKPAAKTSMHCYRDYRIWTGHEYDKHDREEFHSKEVGTTILNRKESNKTTKYLDEHILHRDPSRISDNRKRRIRFSDSQLSFMRKAYENNPYPSHEERHGLSKVMGVDEARIQVWFSNRRAKDKRSQPGSEDDCVTQHTTLLSDSGLPFLCCAHCYKQPTIVSPSSYGPSRLFFPPGYRPSG